MHFAIFYEPVSRVQVHCTFLINLGVFSAMESRKHEPHWAQYLNPPLHSLVSRCLCKRCFGITRLYIYFFNVFLWCFSGNWSLLDVGASNLWVFKHNSKSPLKINELSQMIFWNKTLIKTSRGLILNNVNFYKNLLKYTIRNL